MHSVELTVIGKPDCHLCDVASESINSVIEEISEQVSVDVQKFSILDDEALYEKYWEKIPVILINGVEHAHWRVRPEKLRAAILEAN